MLKKAGIVVAAATAGLLAVSPLAFAGGLVSIDDNDVQIPIQACGNQVLNNVLGVIARQSNKQKGDVDCDQKNSSKRKSHHDD